MKTWKPLFFEHSKIPVWLSRLAPIEINAITLFCFVFSREEISERTKRHETIHFQQYLETAVVGFLLVYLFDYLWASLVSRKGFTRDSYLSIRFEQEAHSKDDLLDYLATRKRFAWIKYPLGGEKSDV